jgi:heme/copper-type cytochrome/quinol oxidase subunit 2
MTMAHSVDLVDVWFITILLLVYALAFCVFFAVFRLRQRRIQALHRKRLEQLRGQPTDTP